MKGTNLRYQKIEKLALAMVITARKLRHYYQGHLVVIKINYLVKQVLKKLNLSRRMVSWAIELSEYDITFKQKRNKVLASGRLPRRIYIIG